MGDFIKISRPRFWMYTFGTFLIGIGASTNINSAVTNDFMIFLWLIFFTFPANFFIYGINDLADDDTDSFNPKKGTYEAKIKKSQHRKIIFWIILTNIIFLPLFYYAKNEVKIMISIFYLFNILYSLKPIRLKGVPILDSLSNGVICVSVGLLGYLLAGGSNIVWSYTIAGGLWCSAMHAYSAIPDIEADRKAGVKTIATLLDSQWTLYVCTIVYFLISVIFLYKNMTWYALLSVPYIILMILSFIKIRENKPIFMIYRFFPIVTLCVGGVIYALNISLT